MPWCGVAECPCRGTADAGGSHDLAGGFVFGWDMVRVLMTRLTRVRIGAGIIG